MSLIDDVNEIASLVDKSKNIELYTKILALEAKVYEANKENREYQERNHELKEILKFKETLTFKEPVYFAEGDNTPYCPNCWESENRPIHLTVNKNSSEGSCYCQKCKALYHTRQKTYTPSDHVDDYDDDDY